ncbi:hypothetical protein UE94_012640 [Burkholderia cenocepacia]|uniref:hypothetical protein n=1 Tax=Burkholderia cenocepacia TaxID=95486 RepID=UPI0015C460C0|nr:hypothetical protein [Burkholderia cenocepacia]MCW3688919.1 hypothetical protein [Burkholderia cenocepacia]
MENTSNKPKDKNVMIPVREETISAMREVREMERFNWSAYLRNCIQDKLNQFEASRK